MKLILVLNSMQALGIGQERKWFVGIEYAFQSKSDFNAINFNNNIESILLMFNQFKVGGFYIPRYNAPRGYFKRIVYRAGLRIMKLE